MERFNSDRSSQQNEKNFSEEFGSETDIQEVTEQKKKAEENAKGKHFDEEFGSETDVQEVKEDRKAQNKKNESNK